MSTAFPQPLDDFRTTLASPHVAADGQLVLAASPGSLGGGRYWIVTALANADTTSESVLGIFKSTASSGATLSSVTRLDGADANLASGTAIQIRPTAEGEIALQGAVNAAEVTIAGLGTASTHNASDFDAAGLAAAALASAESFTTSGLAGKQPTGSYLTALTADVTASGPGSAAATVVALQGKSVSTTTPSDTYVLTWVTSTSKWTPVAAAGGGITIGTTAVSGGTDGGVLYQSSGVVQDSNQITIIAGFILAGGQVDIVFAGVGSVTVGTMGKFNAQSGANIQVCNPVIVSGVSSGGSPGVCATVRGDASQAFPLIDLQQISSTSTARDVAYVDGQFNSAVDASFTGAAVLDANSHAGTEHGLRIDSTGTGANAAWFDSASPNYQAMVGGHFLPNCTTAPTGNPSGGGFFYVTAGALWYLGSSGTSTKIANA